MKNPDMTDPPVLKGHEERGAALVTALIFLAVLTIFAAAAVTTTITDTRLAARFKVEQKAHFIAEAGFQHALGVLAGMTFQEALDGPDGDKSATADNGILGAVGAGPRSYGDGTYSVRIVGTVPGNWTDTDSKVFVRSTGICGSARRTVEVLIERKLPGNIRGAVTTNGPASTSGNLRIDGRDHDMSGTDVVSSNGVYGVSTRNTFSQGGSSDVGGTSSTHSNYAPSRPANAAVVEQNATWPPPVTPDEVLDLPAGTLKSLAQASGKYYNGTTPSGTLSGVTYIEGDWDNATINGSGILVLHNLTNEAFLNKFQAGTFTGLIIADKLDKIHGTLVGAISVLSTVHTGIGNGSGEVIFSRAALDHAMLSGGIKPKVLTWRDGE